MAKYLFKGKEVVLEPITLKYLSKEDKDQLQPIGDDVDVPREFKKTTRRRKAKTDAENQE